jgi:hypothetical protein
MATRSCPNGHKVKDSKALKCPQCGEDLLPVKKRSKIVLGLGILMLLMVCAIVAIATGGDKEEKKVTSPTTVIQVASSSTKPSEQKSTPTEQVKATARPTVEPSPTPMPEKLTMLGDIVQEEGYFLCALQVVNPAEPGMFYKADEGKKLVAVEIVVGNITGKQISVNPLYASIVDTDGFAYSLELAAVDDQLITTAIDVGEKVRGWVAFEVPITAEPAILKYSTALFSSKSLQVGLGGESVSSIKDIDTLGNPVDAPGMNHPVEDHGILLMATAVEDPAPAGLFYKPVDGWKLVAVEIVVGNQTLDELSVNPLYASLVDTDGFVYNLELAGRDGQLDTIKLAKGEKAKGWVAFVIPQSAQMHTVRYNAEVLQSKLLRVQIAQ